MKMKNIRNGRLYRDTETQEIVRARRVLNSSSVAVSKPHSDDLKAVKANNLDLLPDEEVETYLKGAEVTPDLPPLPQQNWRQGFAPTS
jgi:hypothetical protein